MRSIPTPQQLAFLDWEVGAFFHFGIRSFFTGHKDWDNRPMPAEAFCPDQLDCGQWLRAAKAMGASYAIMTCKHHDGFANWPSKYTAYSVAASPCGRDVVREFTDACRENGLRVGLYYSPAQWGGEAACADDKAYDDYFIGQLSELLTNYGPIDYLWLDGCGSEGRRYDAPRILSEIYRLQPNLLIFGGVLGERTGVRWIGNEDGIAPLPNPCDSDEPAFSSLVESPLRNTHAFSPAECDMMLRDTWFDCEENERTVKTPAELFGHYELTVGRGSNLLINAGPNRHGLLNEADVAAMTGLGEKIRRAYGAPLPYLPFVQTGEGRFCLPHGALSGGDPRAVPLCNRLSLMEELSQGQACRAFSLYGYLGRTQNQRVLLYQGTTIGHKCICPFPAMRVSKFEVEIMESESPVRLRGMSAYYAEG